MLKSGMPYHAPASGANSGVRQPFRPWYGKMCTVTYHADDEDLGREETAGTGGVPWYSTRQCCSSPQRNHAGVHRTEGSEQTHRVGEYLEKTGRAARGGLGLRLRIQRRLALHGLLPLLLYVDEWRSMSRMTKYWKPTCPLRGQSCYRSGIEVSLRESVIDHSCFPA